MGEDATDPSRIAEPDLVFYFDGMSTTVSVERWGRHLALKNNGKVDASNGEDMSTQIMVAGYPLLFHPDGPEGLRLVNIGFGSGTTLGTAAQFPVEPDRHRRARALDLRVRLDRAEGPRARSDGSTSGGSVPARGSSPRSTTTRGPIPGCNVINNDGRNYLASTTRRYDIIISEPSNPWITGVSDLFTVDHFRAASQALAPHGIFCQWVQLYELSPENIQAVFRAIAGRLPLHDRLCRRGPLVGHGDPGLLRSDPAGLRAGASAA